MNTYGLREPRQSRSRDTLERILNSGTALITEQSYDDITIAEIAKRAQTSVGGFYSRFSNKEVLFNALQQRLIEETQEKLAEAMAKDWSSTGLQDLLHHIVSNNAELYEKYRGVLKVIHIRSRLIHSPKEDNSISIYNSKLIGQLENLILVKREQIQHRQSRVAIRTAIACMTSMLRDAIVFNDTIYYPEPRDTPTITRRVSQVMYRYLAASL